MARFYRLYNLTRYDATGWRLPGGERAREAADFLPGLGTAAGWISPARAQPELSEAQKITHVDAKYQSMQHGQQRREICLQFEPPDHCKIVQSPIAAHGWCQYFAARENAH